MRLRVNSWALAAEYMENYCPEHLKPFEIVLVIIPYGCSISITICSLEWLKALFINIIFYKWFGMYQMTRHKVSNIIANRDRKLSPSCSPAWFYRASYVHRTYNFNNISQYQITDSNKLFCYNT